MCGCLVTPLERRALCRTSRFAFASWQPSTLAPTIYGDIPVGDYSSTNLANIGIGHGAADAGAGYTYFNPQVGHEFSAVTGFTHNLINPSWSARAMTHLSNETVGQSAEWRDA